MSKAPEGYHGESGQSISNRRHYLNYYMVHFFNQIQLLYCH